MSEKGRVELPKSRDEQEVSRVVLKSLGRWGADPTVKGRLIHDKIPIAFLGELNPQLNISALMEAAGKDLKERNFVSLEAVKLMFPNTKVAFK